MGQHTHNDDQVDQAVIQASILPGVGEVGEDLRGHSESFSFHLTSLIAPDVSCPCLTAKPLEQRLPTHAY